MIVCLRTVNVPAEERARYLDWIAAGRSVREAHAISPNWCASQPDGDTVVISDLARPRNLRRVDRHPRT